MIDLLIPFDVHPQKRVGQRKSSNGKVRRYDPSKKLKQDFSLLVKSKYKGQPLSCPLSVTISISRNLQPTNNNFGDVDNLAKFVLDACNGILWQDDRLIVDLLVYKFFTDSEPYIALTCYER